MTSSIAVESLIQQGRSQLYRDLVDLIQSTQKALYDSPRASPEMVKNSLRKSKFSERLKSIVSEYMGITLNGIWIIEEYYPNAIATITFTKSHASTLATKGWTTGVALDKINNLYDDKLGKLLDRKILKDSFKFGLQINTGWWTLRESDGSFIFSPDEVAAVILHELGHFDNWIRTACRAYSKITDASDLIGYIEKYPDKQVILVLLDRLSKSPYLNKTWLSTLEVTKDYFNKTNSFDDQVYWEALSTLFLLVEAELSSVTLKSFNDAIFVSNFNTKQRYQQVKTSSLSLEEERNADEFSVRNGAYQALVSSLYKIDQLDGVKSTVVYSQFLGAIPTVICGMLTHFKYTFNVSAEDIANGYDPLIRRLELIVETAKHAFSDINLPPYLKAEIHIQITEVETYINNYRNSPHRKTRVILKQWLDNVGKFGRIFKSPFDNKLSGDYNHLQEATRSLSRHPLYYMADK